MQINFVPGFRRIWHSGGLFSYSSLIWLYPDEQVGVFANLNGPGTAGAPGYALKTVLSYVSDILLRQPPWLSTQTACSYPSPWVNSTEFSSSDLVNYTNKKINDFVGTYGNKLLPDITIYIKERGTAERYLWLEMNRIKGELVPTADDNLFRFKMVEPWEYAIERVLGENFVITYPVNFTRSASGTVQSFNLTFGYKEIMMYRKNWKFLGDTSMSRSIHSSFLFVLSLFLLAEAFLITVV